MSRVRVRRPRRYGATAIALTTALLGILALPASSLAGIGFVTSWGTPGKGIGQFSFPNGVATGPAENVYVSDFNNPRIQKFSPSGGFLLMWGPPTGPFSLFPTDIATDSSGNVYVAGQTNEIHRFTASGALLSQWGSNGDGNGEFAAPRGVATGPDGSVYVADRENHRIQKFSSTGTFITKWGKKGKDGKGELKFPQGVATDAAGSVYVADTDGERIQKFTSGGDFLAQWGTRGTGSRQFKSPEDVATDPAGNVYVADTVNHRIQKFTPGGRLLTKWGKKGSAAGQFDGPGGVATDAFGNVYIADGGNARIQKFHDLVVKASAKKAQNVDKLKVKVSCPKEACTLKLTGQATASGSKSNRAAAAARAKFKLKQRSVALQAGQKRSVRLKLRGKSLKELSRLIRKGRSAKVTINVRATAPNLDLEPKKVKVKKLR